MNFSVDAYNAQKISINQYIKLLSEFGLKLSGLKKLTTIDIEIRKQRALYILIKKCNELQREEKINNMKEKLKILM
jgi:hypothetical protein